jgi:predicted DNA-binding transcriptional regulator AlpA
MQKQKTIRKQKGTRAGEPARSPFDARQMLSKRDLAEFFKISSRSVDRLIVSPGFPPGVRVGGLLRFRWEAVSAFANGEEATR